MTTNTLTRKEAEEQILEHAKIILEVYRTYYPAGDYLYTMLSKHSITIRNDCGYGGTDYDFPILIDVNE